MQPESKFCCGRILSGGVGAGADFLGSKPSPRRGEIWRVRSSRRETRTSRAERWRFQSDKAMEKEVILPVGLLNSLSTAPAGEKRWFSVVTVGRVREKTRLRGEQLQLATVPSLYTHCQEQTQWQYLSKSSDRTRQVKHIHLSAGPIIHPSSRPSDSLNMTL